MRTSIWILALFLAVTLPLQALAQRAPPTMDADEMFRLGRQTFEKGEFKRALELFQESYSRAPSEKKLANIARTEARLGLTGSAMRHFQEAVDKLPETDPLRAAIAKEVLELSPRVSYLRIARAPGAPEGTEVKLDGEPVAEERLGKYLPVDPGKRVVTATAPGAKEKAFEVTAEEGGHSTVSVAPVAVPPVAVPVAPSSALQIKTPPVATPSQAPSRRMSPLVPVGFTIGGIGLAVGSITGGISLAKTSRLKEQCPNDCGGHQNDAIASANLFASISNVTLAVGAAGIVLGVVGFVLPKHKEPAKAARIEPVFGPNAIGARGIF